MPGVRMTVEQYKALLARNQAVQPATKKPKYRNKKAQIGDVQFDSKREAKRYQELKALAHMGQISELELQVRFELIPKQRTPSGKAERGCDYIADFRYRNKFGHLVVEDTKGFRTADYIIKRKLMLKIHGIEIQEV